jgi:hypothetical protein
MSHLPIQSTGIARYSVQVPGFITTKEIGLGDVIKHATSTIGFQPCGGCQRRAVALNRMLVFSGRGGRN